jgi:PAS domain S-box-containing protein
MISRQDSQYPASGASVLKQDSPEYRDGNRTVPARTALSPALEGAAILDPGGGILDADEAFATLFQTPLQSAIGAYFQEFVAPADSTIVSALLRGSVEGKVRIRSKADGTVLRVAAAYPSTMSGPQGIWVIVDVPEEPAEGVALVAAREAVVVVDASGRIAWASEAAVELAGSPLAGLGFDDTFSIRDVSGEACPFHKMLPRAQQGRAVVRLPGGREIAILFRANPIPDGAGCVFSLTDAEAHRLQDEHLELHLELDLELFRALVDGVQDYAIFMLDGEGVIRTWNDGAARMQGYSASEIVGRHFSCFYPSEDLDAGYPAHELTVARREGKFHAEGWRIRRDGSRFWASVLITALRDRHGVFQGFAELTRDMTERKRTEDRLMESERSQRELADAMPEIVFTVHPDGTPDYGNLRWAELTGLPAVTDLEGSWRTLLHPDDLASFREAWQYSFRSGCGFERELRLWDRNLGGHRWHLTRAVPLRDAQGNISKWIGTSTDIHDRKRLSQQFEELVDERTRQLREALAEKNTLLQEVHHRVKNNLQTICSLISLQMNGAAEDGCHGPLQAAHGRVLAMAGIHEQIIRSDTVAQLDFAAYVESLTRDLFSAYCLEPSRIRLEREVEDIYLSLQQAIPCGLILNELLSNSLKHAFRDGRSGTIRISARTREDGRSAELEVADDGAGLPQGFRMEDSPSLGLQVVRSLIRQLRGEIFVDGGSGTSFRFRWPLVAA